MPIRINLLADDQEAEEAARKSPVRFAKWIAAFSALAVLCWMLKLSLDIRFTQQSFDNLRHQTADLEQIKTATMRNLTRMDDVNQKILALNRLTTNRFFWAPLLSSLQRTVVDDVQVTRVAGDQEFETETPLPGSRAPRAAIETLTLTIQAVDTSTNQDAWEIFLRNLDRSDYFSANSDFTNAFQLQGILRAQHGDSSNLPDKYATFVLVSHFPAVRHK